MPFFKYLDEKSDITDILFNDNKRFSPINKFTEHLLRADSPLSIAERELIAAFVSGVNECNYCHGIHKAVAVNFGISPSIIESLLKDVDTSEVSDKLKPIMQYVKKLTLTPSKMVQEDADKVYAAGWPEQALYDAICICGLFNFYNRLLDGHGIKGHDKIFKFGADHLHKNGYGIPWFIKWVKKFIVKQKRKALDDM